MEYTNEKLEQLRRRWQTSKGKKLVKIIKETRCYLSPINFREKIHNLPFINDEEVIDGIDLRGIPLSGFDFRISVPDGDDGFTEELAILSNIHFEGAALKHCNFQEGKIHECYFENADISHSNFQNATLNNCSFKESNCTGIRLNGAKLINCNFVDADIKDLTFDSTIVDQKTNFGKVLKSEKEGNYHFASIEYKQIQQMYKNSSLHNLADQYHYKEMVAKRKISKITNPARWLNYLFGDLLCKYGMSFVRVLIWALLIILVCAAFYASSGSLLYQNKIIDSSFADAVYFSVSTFTTLGYGDYHVVGPMRFLAGAESFIGAATISLFTVIVARRIIRD